MCGLTGFLSGNAGDDGDVVMLRRMADTLTHRGPDDGGVWCDSEQRIGLGHRRLAIVDLSPAGHQPMVSASGRFVIEETKWTIKQRGRIYLIRNAVLNNKSVPFVCCRWIRFRRSREGGKPAKQSTGSPPSRG